VPASPCHPLQASAGWEEYVDYIFPEDERGLGSLKLLENAAKWKAAKLLASSQGGAGASAGVCAPPRLAPPCAVLPV
jgi:hypothetical protein